MMEASLEEASHVLGRKLVRNLAHFEQRRLSPVRRRLSRVAGGNDGGWKVNGWIADTKAPRGQVFSDNCAEQRSNTE